MYKYLLRSSSITSLHLTKVFGYNDEQKNERHRLYVPVEKIASIVDMLLVGSNRKQN
jgi:hypothetical protein